MRSAYLDEFRVNSRALVAASIGLATGFSLNNFIAGTFAPYVLHEFGWTKAAFAEVHRMSLIVLFVMPFVGRLTDVFGVRRVAAIGIFTFPLTLLAASLMTGDILQYYAIVAAQSVFCICATTTVYSRIVVERFTLARGLALAIFASAPAALGAVATPALNAFIADFGWRSGYELLAAGSLAVGLVTLALMPRSRDQKIAAVSTEKRTASQDYARVFRNPAFWLIVVALILCNLPQVIYLSQMNLMLIDKGMTAAGAAAIVSAFAIGNIVGRFGCGIALDRFPLHIVAALSMAWPCTGFFLLASSLNDPWMLYLAVFILGTAFGAEGDLMGYMVIRLFGIEVYSSALALLSASLVIAMAGGAQLLGMTLSATGSFTLFLSISAWTVLAGGLLFLLLGFRNQTGETVHGVQPVLEPA